MAWDAVTFNDCLILACEDGALRAFNEEFILEKQSRNYEHKRALCLATSESVIVAGYQNGFVRAFDKNLDNTIQISLRE